VDTLINEYDGEEKEQQKKEEEEEENGIEVLSCVILHNGHRVLGWEDKLIRRVAQEKKKKKKEVT